MNPRNEFLCHNWDGRGKTLSCNRSRTRKAEELNKLAVEGIYEGRRPIAVLDGDIDINPANCDKDGFRQDRRPIPAKVPIYAGSRLYLTQNVRKEDDYVNGMACTVVRYTPCGDGGTLLVRTKTNQLLSITKWTNKKVDGRSVRHFPIRLGYASTIHKARGEERQRQRPSPWQKRSLVGQPERDATES